MTSARSAMAQTSVVTGERRPAAKSDRAWEASVSSPSGCRGRGLEAAGAGAGVEGAGGAVVGGGVAVGSMAAARGATAAGDARQWLVDWLSVEAEGIWGRWWSEKGGGALPNSDDSGKEVVCVLICREPVGVRPCGLWRRSRSICRPYHFSQ
jgi:hypothetical protein